MAIDTTIIPAKIDVPAIKADIIADVNTIVNPIILKPEQLYLINKCLSTNVDIDYLIYIE